MAVLGAVAVKMQAPGAVKVITAEVGLTAQPVGPAEFTEYDGVPVLGPVLITASSEATEPEFIAVKVVMGAQVIDRVALETLIVNDTGADALCDEVAPATT